MPDFVSRKRLKKKVIDRWENEGGMTPPIGQKPLRTIHRRSGTERICGYSFRRTVRGTGRNHPFVKDSRVAAASLKK